MKTRLKAVAGWAVEAVLVSAYVASGYVILVLLLGKRVDAEAPAYTIFAIVASTFVAVGLPQVKKAIRRATRRLLSGFAEDPQEVLQKFSQQILSHESPYQVLSIMARTVSDATRSPVAIHVAVGNELVEVASSREDSGNEKVDVVSPPNAVVVPIHSGGQLIGRFSVEVPARVQLHGREKQLIDDLAIHAVPVIRSIKLEEDLRLRVAEITSKAEALRQTRRRVVEAEDAVRRSLEQNLHDGAQQYLTAMAIRLGHASLLSSDQPHEADEVIRDVRRLEQDAVRLLREFTEGVYPGELSESGIVSALHAQTRAVPVPVQVRGSIGRFDPEIEAAVFFTCLEAIQNALKHADATHIEVFLDQVEGTLRFTVTDDGRGFDSPEGGRGQGLTHMQDRIGALGGELQIQSTPGQGTVVAARLSVAALVLAR